MPHRPFFVRAVALAVPVAVVGACAGTPASPPKQAAPKPGAPRPLLLAVPAPSATTALVAAGPVVPDRPPPPVVTVPMPGEPAESALAEARLLTSSCDDFEAAAKRLAEDRVKQMKAAVDDVYRNWQKQRSRCSGGQWKASAGIDGAARRNSYAADAAVAAPRPAASAPAPKARSASGTNNQVAGVDEADIVKNDGRYVYLAMNGALRIVSALEPQLVSVTRLPGQVRQLFVEKDRAVVYTAYGGTGRAPCTYGYDCQFAGDGSSTKIMVFDVTHRAAPALVREVDLSGSLMAARRIGEAVHTVVSDGESDADAYETWPRDLDYCTKDLSGAKAKFEKLKRDNMRQLLSHVALPVIRDHGVERPLCDHLYQSSISDGGAFTTVVSFDLSNDAAPAETATVRSRPGAIFASEGALYVSTVHHRKKGPGRWYSFYPQVDEVSDLHKFHIGGRAGETRYVGSGAVPGHVLNQFSMDEYYGYLRIATTRGRVPDPKVESVVSILAESPSGNLVRVGAVPHIAPGEDIRAVRFDGDRGYVVTFEKTDPLFVLDLYDPSRPAVLGELEIPGFSTYMHRIDPAHLLSIGFDANDHGSFAFFDGLLLQLFDVTNPTGPRLLHREKIGTRGSSSEAATNHLAFDYLAEKGLLAIPTTICEGGGDGRAGEELTFSGLLVYHVSVADGFFRLGGIDHGTRGAGCGTWWSQAESTVKRSIFLDDLVYSIATDRLKVQRLGRLGKDVADIGLLP